MVSKDDDIKVFHLDLPARTEDIARLELGSAVYLNGLVYTAREGVYKKVLDEGLAPPVDLRALSNVNFHCSPAAAPDGQGGYRSAPSRPRPRSAFPNGFRAGWRKPAAAS